jgi:hypothetical protein
LACRRRSPESSTKPTRAGTSSTHCEVGNEYPQNKAAPLCQLATGLGQDNRPDVQAVHFGTNRQRDAEQLIAGKIDRKEMNICGPLQELMDLNAERRGCSSYKVSEVEALEHCRLDDMLVFVKNKLEERENEPVR